MRRCNLVDLSETSVKRKTKIQSKIPLIIFCKTNAAIETGLKWKTTQLLLAETSGPVSVSHPNTRSLPDRASFPWRVCC